MNLNPFAELARVADRGYIERAPLPEEDPAQGPPLFTLSGTRTDALLELLTKRGRLTTAELARATGLQDKLVWGLLKARRTAGQVVHDGEAWEINEAWIPPEIKRAVELLRSRGWTCVAPGAKS
ncbi:hypothetical protein [Azohydromonas lata]|uniref:hypothetical protein n=1 Tax=Azohydromonas lata TaxID=45677 RepID=UPI00082E7C03|nr:hypothetical protein [Azohydromonas lata]